MRHLKIEQNTTARTPVIDLYLNEVSKTTLINAKEEVELSVKIKEGDKKALNKLVTANLRFVVSVAKQYQGQGLSLSDLISEGNIGLIIAAKRFDESKGFKFISYAVWWIRSKIIQALTEISRTIRLPANKNAEIVKIRKATEKFEQLNERGPSNAELAEILDLPVSKVSIKYRRCASLDFRIEKNDGKKSDTLGNVLPSNENPTDYSVSHTDSLNADMHAVLSSLPPELCYVLKLHFGIDGYHQHTLDEIANKIGVCRESVRQKRQKALRLLKQSFRANKLKEYL